MDGRDRVTGPARVLVLHAYSTGNAGDGMLVREAIHLAHEVLGQDAQVTLAASDPGSFAGWGLQVVGSKPGWRGWNRAYRRVLADVGSFDLVLGVGGGYLRFGSIRETLVHTLVDLPQLRAAARLGRRVVYLPQSVGPLRFGSKRPVTGWLGTVDRLFARDDRTLAEVGTAVRSPDMGLLVDDWRPPRPGPLDRVPVLSVRDVRGRVPGTVRALAGRLGVFDGFVQSVVGHNDDRAATASLSPRRLLERDKLLDDGPGRVVVAMRLHAAIMALAAGHWVVHLAYERKGFGAFDDLGLSGWVHPASRFDVDKVCTQVKTLLNDEKTRAGYAAATATAQQGLRRARAELVEEVCRCVSTD